MMRRNMKRMMAAALAGVMTASLALTGCGGKDKKSDSGEKVITVWSWDVALMQLQAAAEEYQKDHPDIKFERSEEHTSELQSQR